MEGSKLSLLSSVDTHWCIEPTRAEGFVGALSLLPATAFAENAGVPELAASVGEMAYGSGDGVAYISLVGPMTKRMSSGTWALGGTSTLELRKIVRECSRDDRVKGLFLYIDSPGGQVSGTAELARDIKALAAKKPVLAFCSDMCASAAYWVASQATKIVAEPDSMIGSIGAFNVLRDSSKLYESAGVKVHLITTGRHKGVGTDGVPIEDDQLESFQMIVDQIQASFSGAIQSGRGMEPDAVAAVATGEVWCAKEALVFGLVDSIASEDEAYQMLLDLIAAPGSEQGRALAAEANGNEDMKHTKQLIAGLFGRDSGEAAVAEPDAEITAASAQAQIDDLSQTLESTELELTKANQAKDAVLLQVLKAQSEGFASGLISAGKATPAQRIKIAEAYATAVVADGGGQVSVDPVSGEIKTGQMVERIKAIFADAPSAIVTQEQAATVAGDGVILTLPADRKESVDAKVDRILALTDGGKRVIKLRGQK